MTLNDATAAPTPLERPAYRYYVLGLLMVVYTFNFIDRQVLAILAPYIQAEMNFTDSQLGLLGGPAFAVVYSTLALPIAWLADRVSRTSIIATALAVWSGFTALCGLATGFTFLFGARMGVGVGEAGGVAPSYSLVADYFPKMQRARALAVYSFGVSIGTALGYLFGGLLAAAIDWRAAFIVIGLAGVLLAPLLKLTVKDPVRGRYDRAAPGADASGIVTPLVPVKAASFGEVWAILLKKPSFWFLSFGAACSSVYGYGAAFWLPSFFQRSLGMEGAERAWYMAGISFIGGTAGIWLGGWLADKLGKGVKKATYPLVPAVGFIIAVPLFFIAMNTPDKWTAFALFLVPQALALAWLGPITTAVQHLVPAHMRSTASASFLLINNLVGIGLGIYLLGAVSDYLTPRFAEEALRYSLYVGQWFYALAAILLFIAARSLRRDWVD
ncbi:spinster family MFS transporter [Brevundimonas subvibrioides]|uniref:Major facilitator superfamily MFS_1 n=1 Tax=Brevundimonas subvibrioides (strain ATCC 15264 / DSM 4735 / LMG 14903 / NBRC 16000 / CB 81) TaxID=633149 RepID=D9QKG1_BRESC|nr:MFS transporter [Brevundimonas subvibrioides]ADK99786.1 major facilitator superfamily MFS_1 [Brevundimonas subvibrioides ATCC 15264]